MTAKQLLFVIAALFLATEAAFPAYASEVWLFSDYKRCTARTEFKVYPDWRQRGKEFEKEIDKWPNAEIEQNPDKAIVTFERKHLAKLEAAVRFLKKCRIWIWDHHRGKAIYLTPKEMKELDNADY